MRRVRVSDVVLGDILLDKPQAHYVRDVLRLREGAEIEVFDAEGKTGRGSILRAASGEVIVRVARMQDAQKEGFWWVIASAIPKGQRADWMIEKLSELGVSAFMPLCSARSVVLPAGVAKRQRWERLAAAAAGQSGRAGVMRIADPTDVQRLLGQMQLPAWYLSTDPQAHPISETVANLAAMARLRKITILVGPEGGWDQREVVAFEKAGLTGVSLGATILRVETAAVAVAAIVAGILLPGLRRKTEQT